MYVCGANDHYQLDKNPHEIGLGGRSVINPHIKFHIDPSALLSISTLADHTVWITQDGKAYAIGDNTDGRICGSLPEELFIEDKEVILKDEKGQPFKFISVVCGDSYTLYLVSSQSTENNFQLVYCSSHEEPLILNAVFNSPVSLFGSEMHLGAIDSSGKIIVINYRIFDTPKKRIEAISLPSNDRAVKLALCFDFVIALSSSGHVYQSKIAYKTEIKFTEIEYFRNETVADVAGCNNFCFVVLNDGRVFGLGSNDECCLCLPSTTESVSNFTFIESLKEYKIVSVYVGGKGAIFKTDKSEIIVCGANSHGQRFVPLDWSVYPPVKIDEFSNVSFCIAGYASIVFDGINPPKNIPNKKIEISSNQMDSSRPKKSLSRFKPKTSRISSSEKVSSSESSTEIERLKRELSLKEEEILKLGKVNSTLEASNNKYKEEILKLEKVNSTLEASNSKYKEEISSLKSEVEQMKKEKKPASEPTKSSENRKNHTIQILGDSEMSELEKVKKIGRGATSEVFEVINKKRFALKVLDIELFRATHKDEGSESDSDEHSKSKDDDEEDQNEIELDIDKLKRFVKESEVLNQLDHVNIIKTFGIFFGNRHQEPSILLEYCESNLKRRVKKLAKEDRSRIIVELSSAMKEVHRVGIIHRDLKLENILLDSNNHVKVSDFGLCTFIKSEEGTMSHTQMVGSLIYMAPELLQGRTDYDEKVDVYSFGVVVFVILSKGEFPSISIADVGNGKQAPIPSSFSKFSKKLIQECWSSNPKERPSFSDIFSRLEGNEDKLI